MMKIDAQFIRTLLNQQHFDCCAVASIDFKSATYESLDINPQGQKLFYDLASLTKPLTLASYALYNPSPFSDQLQLLLNHRAGLPSGGRLSYFDWQKQLLKYPIVASDTRYSDYSALRLQLELESIMQQPLEVLSSFFWDSELKPWQQLDQLAVITGMRHGRDIQGVVHDDNAFVLNCFTAHAGLFATIDGLAKSILELDRQVNLLPEMQRCLKNSTERFVRGWDRVEDPSTSLAGERASRQTFGHLGFTGTSLWIDCERQQGIIVLTNATKKYWYAREGLNQLRKIIHNKLWR